MVSIFHWKSQNEILHFIERLPKSHDQEPFTIICYILFLFSAKMD